MRKMIDLALAHVSQWHGDGRTYAFIDSISLQLSEEQATVIELAYWDYCGWHLQERFPETAMEAQKANRNRCEVMDKFDEWYETRLKPPSSDRFPAPSMIPNTETMGSLLDRIINHKIKLRHLRQDTPKMTKDGNTIAVELDWLIRATIQLDEDCVAGRRYVFPFSRFKVGYPT